MNNVRPWLSVGKYRETCDRELLDAHRVSAILQLARPVEQPGIARLFLPVEDGVPLPSHVLAEGVRFIREQKAQRSVVLVACGAGISRSVTFAMAALMEEEGLTLSDSYREIRRSHPDAMPHPELYRSLAAYHGLQMSLEEAWDDIYRVQQESE